MNPSSTLSVDECKYVFPLYDNVSVVGFTCNVGLRRITGIVKEKTKAKEEYNAAVSQGITAGLLEQGPTSDVFVTSVGNIPAGETVIVNITYVQELKHDLGSNSVRHTLPTKISPRYGATEIDVNSTTEPQGGITVTVDVHVDEDSSLQKLQSPSHPISVIIGRLSTDPSEDYDHSKASASLSLQDCALDKDFLLNIHHQHNGQPRALLESHPTINGQRALMATLVPKNIFQLSKPEVIFVADQSGSMQGLRTQTLVSALRIFFKSLPVGIKFNLCLFGSNHSFLFKRSQVYNEGSLAKALNKLKNLNGNYGGTETMSAVQASIESRDPKQDLSVILATDGDIWQQQALFDYLNQSVSQSKKGLRVSALGIGESVSSALVEGVARAGNGFAQCVTNVENLDTKVVRMLKGALTPDHGALNLALMYHPKNDDDDDCVLVERVTDSLRVMVLDEGNSQSEQLNAELNAASQAVNEDDRPGQPASLIGKERRQLRYQSMPMPSAPKLLQTPQDIPPLYPFSRTTVYLLMSPEAPRTTPKSVILRGSSKENPFELEIPVETLSQPSSTIHQLAAKNTMLELEKGRGWLAHAKDIDGISLKDKYSTAFDSIVEREAVRLGVQYQIAGKHTSFVAIDSDNQRMIQDSNQQSFDKDTTLGITITEVPPPQSRSIGPLYPSMYCSSRALAVPGLGARSGGGAPSGRGRTTAKARMSTGGKAPRMQLASKAARKCAILTSEISSLKKKAKLQWRSVAGDDSDVESEEEDEDENAVSTPSIEALNPLQALASLGYNVSGHVLGEEVGG